MAGTPKGRFAWYELMTTDPNAAPDFYTQFTPWATAPWDGADEPYWMWMLGERPLGGLMQLPKEAQDQGAPSHWLVHISTPDVAATAAKAQELGGTVMHQMTVPQVGSFAIIADPHGAVFSAYQPEGDTPGNPGEPEFGDFSWHELYSNNWEESWAFYSALFGWVEESQMEMGEMGTYHMFQQEGGRPLGGMMNRPPEMPMAAWLFYIHVESVAAAADTIKAAGGSIMVEPMEIPGGDHIAICFDPQGASFAVHGKP